MAFFPTKIAEYEKRRDIYIQIKMWWEFRNNNDYYDYDKGVLSYVIVVVVIRRCRLTLLSSYVVVVLSLLLSYVVVVLRGCHRISSSKNGGHSGKHAPK